MHWLPFPPNSYADFVRAVKGNYFDVNVSLTDSIYGPSAEAIFHKMKNRSRSFKVMTNEGLIQKAPLNDDGILWVWTSLGRAIGRSIKFAIQRDKEDPDPRYDPNKGIWLEDLLFHMPFRHRNIIVQLPWRLDLVRTPNWITALIHLKVIYMRSAQSRIMDFCEDEYALVVLDCLKNHPHLLPTEADLPPQIGVRRQVDLDRVDKMRAAVIRMYDQYIKSKPIDYNEPPEPDDDYPGLHKLQLEDDYDAPQKFVELYNPNGDDDEWDII